MKRPSFTLLELLLVLALITAISSLGVAGYKRQYARSQFKSGVVGIQIDLNRTRLLAMRSGQSYIFRFVPGTGFYEIAPLQTLQEAIYRMNDDATSLDGALGGSLYSDDDASLAFAAGAYDYGATGELGVESASDDLFSQENVLADLEQAGRGPSNSVAGANASPLGGTLVGGSPLGTTTDDLGYLSGVASDGLGTGGEFALGAPLDLVGANPIQSITIREMNSEERQIGGTPNTLAWRVNLDGLVVRKEATGGVVFTFSRLSDSTPTNLKKKRPRGAQDAQNAQGAFADSVGEDLGSRLGGSLSSPSTLGGGLNEVSDENADNPAKSSLWSDPIVFFPNGRTSTVVVGLTSVGKYSYYSEIGVRGMTGYARISAITSVPAGTRPEESVLTQEQFFRLANPGVANPDAASRQELAGGALGGDANAFDSSSTGMGGALGLEQNAATYDDGFTSLDATGASGFTPNYGSTERRSGYSFGADSLGANASFGDGGLATSGTNDFGNGAFGQGTGDGATSSLGSTSGLGASSGLGSTSSLGATSELGASSGLGATPSLNAAPLDFGAPDAGGALGGGNAAPQTTTSSPDVSKTPNGNARRRGGAGGGE